MGGARGSEPEARSPRRGAALAQINEEILQQLKNQGFPTGLAQSLSINLQAFPLRIWVVDNSGSMQIPDGTRIVATKSKHNVKFVDCTRWAELKECIQYHIQMAALLNATSTFRLLNPPLGIGVSEFSIAEKGSSSPDILQQDVQYAMSILNRTQPAGVTPLVQHILAIYQQILPMASNLRQNGQRVAVIIATDGLPTDDRGVHGTSVSGQFVDALRTLHSLPVWIVVRLCTDEETVVEYYNQLDEQLEVAVEVLDDFEAEGEEISKVNPWLTYSLPLHRCREMGYHSQLFDLLDERLLTKGELMEFCCLLMGKDCMDGVFDPEEDWDQFSNHLSKLVSKEDEQYNPIKKDKRPWIRMNVLDRAYNESGGCILM